MRYYPFLFTLVSAQTLSVIYNNVTDRGACRSYINEYQILAGMWRSHNPNYNLALPPVTCFSGPVVCLSRLPERQNPCVCYWAPPCLQTGTVPLNPCQEERCLYITNDMTTPQRRAANAPHLTLPRERQCKSTGGVWFPSQCKCVYDETTPRDCHKKPSDKPCEKPRHRKPCHDDRVCHDDRRSHHDDHRRGECDMNDRRRHHDRGHDHGNRDHKDYGDRKVRHRRHHDRDREDYRLHDDRDHHREDNCDRDDCCSRRY
jgi:hypothetical protein